MLRGIRVGSDTGFGFKLSGDVEMDSELEESEILQCTPPSIVIQLYVLLLPMVTLNRPNKCSFFMFSRQKVSCVL